MGSITARPENGHLFFDFRYRGVRCREQTVLPDTPANRKQLEELLAKLETEIKLGTFDYGRYFPESPHARRFAAVAPGGQIASALAPAPVPGPTPTPAQAPAPRYPLFRDFAETWFLQKSPEWRHSHIEGTRYVLDHWLHPEFGGRPIGAITRTKILNFRAGLLRRPGAGKKEHLAPRTVNHILEPLRMILREASEQFGIPNAFSGIKAMKIPRSHVEPFTLEEVELFLENVREDFRNYYTVRFFTGMRPGEINGLKWKNVDFGRRQILVRETWIKGRVEYTKTEGSQREIDMSEPVYQALLAQQKVTSQCEYVFVNTEGQPLDAKNVANRVWYPLLRYLNLPRRVPYQTRHTAATLWLAAGEAPEWIARQMGHTTTEMLFRVYSRYVPNLTRRDGSAFEKLLEAHHMTKEAAP